MVRQGGVVLVAAISRFASTIDGLLSGALDEPAFEAIVERDVSDGQHRNPTDHPRWFTTAYFHLPDELGDEPSLLGASAHLIAVARRPPAGPA